MHAVVGRFRIEICHQYSSAAPNPSTPWRAHARIYHRDEDVLLAATKQTRWCESEKAAVDAATRDGIDSIISLSENPV